MSTDIVRLQEMAEDTTVHKKLVMDNCLLMFNYLTEHDKLQLGIDILKRGAVHDNSKYNADEFKSLASILDSKKCFTDADSMLSEREIKAIEQHWKKNRHHPEYFEDKSEMTELDMIEMVCDWFARSIQYGTDFLPFVKERQKNRFKFKKSQFEIIFNYCKLLEELYNEKHTQSSKSN